MSGKCDETYPEYTTFGHHSRKLHGSDLKLRTKIDDKHEHVATIPCKIAEKGVEVKPREEISENLELSKVTCDKRETNLAPESALKLQNNTYHKNDETTSDRDMIEGAPREMQEASDKYEDLKHKNHSDLAIPDSSEDKAKTDIDFVSPGEMCQELGSRKPVPTFVPQPEELKIDKKSKIIRRWRHLSDIV